MAILKVARMGHPVLRKKGRKLKSEEIRSPEIQRLIEDMIETMHEYTGIGLAAPQVHHSLQLAIIEIPEDSERYPDKDPEPLGVFINPEIQVLDETEQGYWEGCLSIPELRGWVERPRKIEVSYQDREGKKRKIKAEGFLATVFQHELDHLAGVLFIDKVRDTSKLAFLEEYQRYWVRPDSPESGEESLEN